MKVLLLIVSLVLFTTVTMAQSNTPSEADLEKWDQQFLPGMYEVDEYSVDADLKRIANTSKQRRYCFSAEELKMVSRLPVAAATTWQCQAMDIKFEPPNFAVTMKCDPETPSGSPVLGMAMIGKLGPNEYQTRLIKTAMEQPPAQNNPLYAVGSSFKRVSDCKK